MADEKDTAPQGPGFSIPLNRREIAIIVLLSAINGGIFSMTDGVLAAQKKSLVKVQREASGIAEMAEFERIKRDIRRAREYRAQNVVWKEILARVESYFPPDEARAISYLDVMAALSNADGAVLVSSTQAPDVVNLEFGVEKKEKDEDAEDDSGMSDESEESTEPVDPENAIPEDMLVRYNELNYSFQATTPFRGWIDFIGNLEAMNRFYRFKKLTMKALPKKKGSGSTRTRSDDPGKKSGPEGQELSVDFEFASYHLVEFTRRASEEDEDL